MFAYDKYNEFHGTTQVVDARAGPGFKLTKPKKIKNSDGKRKSKLKRLHKFKRQSKFTCPFHF